MPINLYIGQSRSGKSYEVVTHVIVGSLRVGRRVVSNIGGLNYQAMFDYLVSDGVSPDSIGQLVMVTNEQVLEPNFFKTDYDEKQGLTSFVQSGDLVALDEIWRFWKKRGDIPDRHMNFFRMHGHYVHQVTGLTCEVVLITQALRDVNESIRDNTHQTFLMQKLTKLGSTNLYTVDIFDKASISKSAHIMQLTPRKYNPAFFVFYKSHTQNESGVIPKEQSTDKRGNLLKGKIFLVLPFLFLMAGFAVYFIWGFLHPKPKNEVLLNASNNSIPENISTSQVPVTVSDTGQTGWILQGYIIKNGLIIAILKSAEGAYRHVVQPDIAFSAMDVKVVIDGQVINNWQNHTDNNQSKSLGIQ